jgi:hypothetical protein
VLRVAASAAAVLPCASRRAVTIQTNEWARRS